ncbi:MAG: response regulator transcription factor [Verrucomicrobia bacterium]|nr:response regulator transcription factor [Verrucomicrobiota bacterium]
MSIAVAIVEDNAEIRRNLSRYIGEAPGFRCACACGSAEEALRVIPKAQPDVVLMDIRLPGMSGIACTASLKEALPTVPVMMLTVYEDNDAIFNALKAGASGYLLKRSAPEKILEAITELHRGGAPMTSEIARKVIASFYRTKPEQHPQDRLTAREREILEDLAKGYVTKEIADRLGVSYDTIRYHLKHIYDKLHVHSRTEAVIKYLG